MKTKADAIKHAKVTAKLFGLASYVYHDAAKNEYHAPGGTRKLPVNRFTKSWRRVAHVSKDGNVIEAVDNPRARIRKPNPRMKLLRAAPNPSQPVQRKSVFVATRSKRKALEFAEQKKGIHHPIAVKAQGGFVVYQAYENAPAKTRVENPTVKGAYWLYLRSGRGWIKLGERPTVPLAKRAAQQIADRTGMQVKIELARGRAS